MRRFKELKAQLRERLSSLTVLKTQTADSQNNLTGEDKPEEQDDTGLFKLIAIETQKIETAEEYINGIQEIYTQTQMKLERADEEIAQYQFNYSEIQNSDLDQGQCIEQLYALDTLLNGARVRREIGLAFLKKLKLEETRWALKNEGFRKAVHFFKFVRDNYRKDKEADVKLLVKSHLDGMLLLYFNTENEYGMVQLARLAQMIIDEVSPIERARILIEKRICRAQIAIAEFELSLSQAILEDTIYDSNTYESLHPRIQIEIRAYRRLCSDMKYDLLALSYNLLDNSESEEHLNNCAATMTEIYVGPVRSFLSIEKMRASNAHPLLVMQQEMLCLERLIAYEQSLLDIFSPYETTAVQALTKLRICATVEKIKNSILDVLQIKQRLKEMQINSQQRTTLFSTKWPINPEEARLRSDILLLTLEIGADYLSLESMTLDNTQMQEYSEELLEDYRAHHRTTFIISASAEFIIPKHLHVRIQALSNHNADIADILIDALDTCKLVADSMDMYLEQDKHLPEGEYEEETSGLGTPPPVPEQCQQLHSLKPF